MDTVRISFASKGQRNQIYRLRHAIYARELGQHAPNSDERLTDALDRFNEYIVATINSEVIGFVSLTSPGSESFSVDKYFSRSELPFPFDAHLFEVRLLTVPTHRRGQIIAGLLMYAVFRWIESRGGTRIVAIGRRELADFYRKAGLQMHGQTVQSGAVTYELMSVTIEHLRHHMARYARPLLKLQQSVCWNLNVPFLVNDQCYHGGAFFDAVGESFDTLERSRQVVNADVLDAWFPPAPGALEALRDHLPWLMRTSPPQESRGLVAAIAAARGIPPESIAVGAGSSSLMFLALREWLDRSSRVLLPDHTYGEYLHIFENVIGCKVERFQLSPADGFRIDPDQLLSHIQREKYDLVVLVNPNNPTGQFIRREALQPLLDNLPRHTRLWVDEAYIDYVDHRESVEVLAAANPRIVVCKSLSKVYALSGARAAYLCGHPSLVRTLRKLTPPWAVSLPAQVAAVAALSDPTYYARRYRETALLRDELAVSLRQAIPHIEVSVGVANFLLCKLPPHAPDATSVCERCWLDDIFLRDVSTLGSHFGSHMLRIAVKDAESNRRIVESLAKAITSFGLKSKLTA
ncbi:MAG: aminotransferase class I/II-fold pyridoxal phosphate-dependent enzyme [Planctomycetaceae bacterium]